MSTKAMRLLKVAPNGQISIGKNWAGKQIRIEEISEGELRISAGTFVPDSQKTFFTEEAGSSLAEFNEWEKENPPIATDTKSLFANLRKKHSNDRK
jgi:hypothetical protein